MDREYPERENPMNELDLTKKIYVAGHRGLVGSALCRKLHDMGASNILTRTHAELDLCEQAAVRDFFAVEKPDYVIIAAAKVGGIHANATYPAQFIYENMQIQSNVIHSAYTHGVKKLLFLGSACIYPKVCPLPIHESALLTAPLEPTNEAYALAKIAGIRMCQAYRQQYGFNAIAAMPANLYGKNDNYHPENSHVIPALLRRFYEATKAGVSKVTIWGTGTAMREFLHVDDMADACIFLLQHYADREHVNIGNQEEYAILDIARKIAHITGFTGMIDTDPTKPDGTPRRVMDCSRLFSMGWRPSITFEDGLRDTYQWYVEQETLGVVRKD